jgi:membrane associated rhomboid family serine protease
VSRFPASGVSYSFGPGPLSPVVRALLIANGLAFLATLAMPVPIIDWLGLRPEAVIEKGRVWQLATYLFIHAPGAFTHILFNMLALWMFGVELERRWGSIAFAKYFFATGVGAGLSVMLVSLLPFAMTAETYAATTIGASGAVYGLLMAWAILFPHRQILFMLIFPVKARLFVLIVGAIAFFSAMGSSGSTVSNIAHLGGLLVGWIYLHGPKDLRLTVRYHLSRWRMTRLRRRFDVHDGGRRNWNDRVH